MQGTENSRKHEWQWPLHWQSWQPFSIPICHKFFQCLDIDCKAIFGNARDTSFAFNVIIDAVRLWYSWLTEAIYSAGFICLDATLCHPRKFDLCSSRTITVEWFYDLIHRTVRYSCRTEWNSAINVNMQAAWSTELIWMQILRHHFFDFQSCCCMAWPECNTAVSVWM